MSDKKHQDSYEDDPYASIAETEKNTMEIEKKESARERKWRKFKTALQQAKEPMKASFIMGSMVGGGFGACIGLYNAFKYRSWIMFPIITISSAGSFGFFLMCGSLIRMAPEQYTNPQLNYQKVNMLSNEVEQDVELWKLKYYAKDL